MTNALAAESSPYLRQHASNPVDWLPWYGGTYFPPEARGGMPAWTQVLQAIAESWSEHREEIRAGGERLRERLSGAGRLQASSQPIHEGELRDAVATIGRSFDRLHG